MESSRTKKEVKYLEGCCLGLKRGCSLLILSELFAELMNNLPDANKLVFHGGRGSAPRRAIL
jgi:uncharacterized protein YggL (DUF469 family)